MTIRALATAGHAIIVGQGGTFITQEMPMAIHLRLVAPLEHRIKYTAARDNLSLHNAAARIVKIDQRRAEFYRRYWPGKRVAPQTFTMTLNSAELSVDEMLQVVLPLVRSRENSERCAADHCQKIAEIFAAADIASNSDNAKSREPKGEIGQINGPAQNSANSRTNVALSGLHLTGGRP
jgi:hypothetical protein